MHRYNKVVFDSSDDEILESITNGGDKYRQGFSLNTNKLPFCKPVTSGIPNLYCDKLCTTIYNNVATGKVEGICLWCSANNTQQTFAIYKGFKSVVEFRTWLQQNPITVVYELATPTREVISTNDNLLLDSYTNGHLDVDSVVPIDKVVFQSYGTSLKYLSPNTEYIIQFESDSNGKLDALALNSSDVIGNLNIVKGINKFNITTSDKITINYLWTTGIGFNMSKIVVTPKVEQPFGYFKGMKSVGECEGNVVEVVAQNKNLFDKNKLQVGNGSLYGYMYLGNDNNYTISITDKDTSVDMSQIYFGFTERGIDANGGLLWLIENGSTYHGTNFTTDFSYFSFYPNNNETLEKITSRFDIQIEEGTKVTTYTASKSNKQTITHEPLRGLPNGVRDKYVLIDGKWYIERNTIQLIMDSTFIQDKKLYHYASTNYPDVIGFSTPNNWFKWNSSLVCDNLVYDGYRNISAGSLISNQEKIFVYDLVFITLNKNKLSSLNEDGFREYLKNNPITLVGQNTTPTYEPIDYNPFEVYTDTTHISNNSTIPCNMVIKNTGYNCILKPSTLYTVALDTNKSGTIGMNLGGVKGTTSNNVATITTPATLTDNTLRLYGKGIKGSKVRLLEGDRTNWIPSHFEGMKSCFEDKLQDDGKYKMEILSNNKNLFDINTYESGLANIEFKNNGFRLYTTKSMSYANAVFRAKVKPFTDYRVYADIKIIKGSALGDAYTTSNYWFANTLDTFNSKNNTELSIRFYCTANVAMIGDVEYTNVRLVEVGHNTDFVENKHNKIQFLLNEPLRAVGNIKDKVYVKEDKIIVERNCGSATFDGSDTWNLNKIENNIYTYSIRSTKFLTKMKVGTWETLMNNKCYIIDKCGTATTSTPKNEQLLIHNTVEDKFIWYSTPLFSTVQSVKQYLNDNPFKILYQLAEPVYEEIEYSNNRLTLNSYDNSTLFYDSNIPVSNTSFKPLWEELVYVKNSTTYYIQFNAVGSGNVVVNLGGTELSTTITEGYNKIEITTPNNSTNLLTIDGQGIKISKVVVSEALCSGYYKGLQSCFEEHMENGKYVCVIRGISLDGSKVNGIKFYLNEPLRGIGDIKDKLCIKDNKLMVERNFIQVIIDGENLQNYNNFAYRTLFDFKCNVLHNWELANFITDSKFSNAFIDYQWNHRDFESIAVSPLDEKTCIDIIDKSISFSIDSYKNILKEKPIKVVYQLLEPIYEEITNEYGLPIILEGYENGIVYVDSAVTPTTSIKYTSNNTVPTTLSNVDNLNTTTQDDINNNIVTYMMDIDMMLTEMEMEDNASTMSLSDSDDNNQKHNTSHNNILDRMNKEDRIKYQDNTTKMLEKVIKGKSLTNEENINRIDLYLSEGKIREEQSNYLKELLKEGE